MDITNSLRRLSRPRFHFVALATLAMIIAGRGAGWPTLQAQPPTNPIVLENQLAGSPQSEWDVSPGSGDPNIQGYATDISVNKGSTVTFKIKLQPAVSGGYVIDIYRLGYYQGLGARFITTVVPTAQQILDAKNQPACLRDDTVGLVDCGNWFVSGSFDTTGLTSGVFIARPRRTDNGGASHIVFIVRDDARKADMLFQTSDTTWQAYNQYPGLADGGSSLYCNGPLDNSPGDYSCASRSAKVSYNRPFDTRDHDKSSWLFNGEYPMIRWLEANGYDTKYWSGVDTDRFGASPTIGLTSAVGPKAFLSVGHDEYWSGQQRTNVESARNGGVSLAFFSGNEMFWKTRYEASIDGSNTSYRTLVSYKETFATGSQRLDPNPANPWTGTWRDPRFSPPLDGGRPENALTGQLWTVNCCADRMVIGSEFKGLRFWRNTAIADLQAGEVYVTPMQTLGYEWDEDIDNGLRPSGLIRMSSTTITEPQKVLDYGINVGPGSATHSLTMYRHNSGAVVFGAGTVQWSYGLDANHDQLPAPPDRAMQQATVNLFADMGVQPLTLQNGADGQPLQPAVTSEDIFAPDSAVSSPVAGASVASGSRVTITGTATEHGGGAVAGVEVSVDGATWHPALRPTAGTWAYDWQPGAVGTATIRTRAIDDSGNLESPGPGTTVNIVVGDCPCTSLWKPSAAPVVPSAADQNPVELGLKFTSDIDGFITGVRFYKGPANNSTHVGNLWTSTGTNLGSVVFSGETATGWQQAMFASPVAITANTTYVVSYHTNVGGYAADGGYLASTGVDSPPLHAPTSAVSGGNGLFAYGATQFPTQTFNASNYWVDVVFAPSLEDTTPPVISAIKSTILDSSRVTITWTTNEQATSKVQYSTDPDLLTNTSSLPPGTITVNQSAFVTLHSVPLTGLTPNTTYYYRVISVDRSGNEAKVNAPTFTVPGPTLRDTSATDFAAGSGAGSYISESADGEVILAPSAASEFSGTAMSPGWTAVPWDSGGFAQVGNGILLVDGSRVGTCVDNGSGCQEQSTLTPGHRLDFVATFSGDAFQHAGLGQTLEGAPWAIFSTGTGGTLFARSLSVAGLVANDEITNGSTYLGQPHRYTIDWQTDHVDYSIDGVLVKTHGFAVEGPMRPIAASDFSVFGGNVVVNWMRLSPYAASAAFESRVFDAGTSVDWRTIQWTAQTPAGTAVAISVRVGDTPTPGAGWTEWQPMATPGALNLTSRYIQYQAALSTSDVNVTPSLDDIIISTGHAPVAVSDSIVVPENGVTTLPASGPASLTANDTDEDGDTLSVIAAGPASHGAVVVLADGSVRYTPAANYNGPDSFAYTVSDGLMTSSATVTIDVRFGNIAPVANADFYTVNEDTSLTVAAINGVLKNDTDVEHDVLSAVLTSLPAHGQLSINSLGSFTYTPAANYAGPDAFTYQAFDGQAYSDPATVQISVLQVNDAPVSVADAFTAVMNQTLTVPARGVLANDHDVEVEDTTPLHAVLVSNPAHGTLTLNADGSFTYTPNADFLGLDSFSYAAADHFNAVGNPVSASITIALKAVAAAVNEGGTVNTGSDVTAADPLISAVTTPSAATIQIAQGVIAGSTPPGGYTFLNQQVNITILNQDGTELQAATTNPIRLAFTIDSSLLQPGEDHTNLQIFRNGTLIPACLGQSVIPASNLDPCVTARESLGGDVRVTILSTHASMWNMGLSSGGTAPQAMDDGVYQVNYQTPLVIPASGVLGNDRATGSVTAQLVEGSESGGTVSLSPSGAFLFMPGAGVCGPASFRYRANDGTTDSNEATVSIVVDCQPTAVADSLTVLEDSGTTTITVLSNDTDPDPGQTLTVTSVGSAAHGLTSILSGGMAVNYAPQANFYGSDSFQYTISDGRGGTSTATVTVTVTPVNDAPSFTKGSNQTVGEDAPAQSVSGFATALSAGPANESAQLLDFLVSNDNAALFAAQPAIAGDGTLTYTPAANANGSATVTVRAHDNGGVADGGVDTSAEQTFIITVTAVNDAPSFTKGADQSVNEDAGAQSVATWASAISAGPADESAQALTFHVTGNSNPSLFAVAPAIDASGRLTYTPADGANGTATISLTLSDNGGTANGGADTSAAQSFTISVLAVNDAPSFVKGADVSVLEDSGVKTVAAWATAISAGPADESSQAVNFTVGNDNNGLFAVQPSLTAAGTLTFTPAANVNGSATVTVQLHDDGGTLLGGSDTSAAQTFIITVTAVNDAPSFTKGADQSVNEDAGAQSVATWASAISAGPANESAQALTFNVTGNSNPSLFAVAPAVDASGRLTYTPAAAANGTATITLTLSDNGGTANGGADTSAAQSFTISVLAVNDAPSFVKGADVSVLEDSGVKTVAAWATAISAGPADESSQAVNFIVGNNNTGLFAVQPSITAGGTLTFTPAANANGVATVTVQLHDDGGTLLGGSDTSATQTFTISVSAVNDAPSFSKGADQSVNEDAGTQSVANWASAISAGPANESAQALTFNVTGNSNPSLFAVAPAVDASGRLTYTAAAAANGTATITLTLSDNGGTANGGVDTTAAQSFTITVVAVNDAPSFLKGANQTVLEDSGAQTVAGWAAAISAGPSDESSQAVNFLVSADNTSLFAVQPAISASGQLSYTPAANAFGVATVTVRLHDNGGTANGGVDTSAPQTFTITITGVNDVPAFVKGADVTALEDAGAQSVAAWATGISAGAGESSQAVNFLVSTTNATLFSTAPAVAANGTLTFTPAANANGVATVTVRVHDDGGTANGGVDTSAPQTFTITVTTVNDAPSFVKGADQTVLVGSGAQSVSSWATSLSAGPADENGQALNFLVSNDNTAIFSAQPAIAANGTLTYTPSATATGTATVTVRIHDNAGTANGGVDTSAAQTFTITVMPKPALSINNITQVEGTGGNTPFVFTVSLSAVSPATTTVNYATSNGTARSGSDYVAASGVLTIPAGSPSGTITISVVGDTTKEKTETFAVTLSSPVNATIADSNGLASILDDDSTPQLNATSTRTAEGNTGTTSLMTFAVAPTNANSEPMTVDYTTVADPTTTTREGIDYTPVTGTITFPPETTDPILIKVPVNGDRRHEKKQRIFLHLMNAVESIVATEGQGDIDDDDPIPTVSIADITVGEASIGKSKAVLTVTLSNDNDDPVTVNYATGDGSAIGGKDFEAASGVLTFQPGETSQVITLAIAPDAYTEGIETFNVVLSSPTNATLGKAQAIVTITPPLAWVTSTADEFAKGSLTDMAVTQSQNGELTLNPAAGAEFTDAKLPAGWTTAVLTAGGTATIDSGIVTVDGLALGWGTAYTAGHSLEFAAKFAATGLQQIGFAVPGGITPPLAMFAMKADGQLYARSATATKSMDTPLGKLAGAAHRFRIDWGAASVDYWVDGAKVASHAVSLGAAALAMRPVIADQGIGDGAVMVDWIRMTPYAATGTYISQVYDAGVQVAWQVLQAVGEIPAGTSVIVDVRTGDTATPDASWTVFRAVTPGDSIASFARYAQYRVRLATSVPTATPIVKEVALAYWK